MSSVISTTLSKAISSSDGFHHLVYSISGTTHTIFLDNSAIAVNVSGGNVFSNYQNISNLFFGIAGDLSYGFTGFLDDVKIFNRALTANDVSTIYATVPTTIVSSEAISIILARYTTSIWLDTSVSGNFVLSGSNITTWKDKTTNGFNLTNNGTITYNSSSPTSVLIPAGSYLRNSSFNMLTSLHTWIFVISMPSASASTDCRIVGLVNSNYGGIDILIQNSRLFIYHHKTTGNGIYYNMSLTSNTKYLISVSFNMSTSYSASLANSIIRINGITQSGSIIITEGSFSSFSTSGSSLGLLVGSLSDNVGYYNSPSNFNIYEIIGINNQALNISDTKTIENYLNTKWNLGYTIA
jgi:hypothetical protein